MHLLITIVLNQLRVRVHFRLHNRQMELLLVKITNFNQTVFTRSIHIDLLYTDTDGETAYQSIGIQQLDRWQKPGDITDVPRLINSYQYARYGSSRHMKSSNHLRLKTVTLSYNLPSKWMQAAGMRNVRIFASGNNLLTWAAYKNIDPEQPVNGVATWALPNLKSVTFGIEIGL